jgi:hypothetical protein
VRGYLIEGILVVLLVYACTFMAAYHWVMFGASPTQEFVIEALNYAVQTVTTVGYGNWVPFGWKADDPDILKRILYVKAISVPFMLVGGALFAVLVGIIANRLSRVSS